MLAAATHKRRLSSSATDTTPGTGCSIDNRTSDEMTDHKARTISKGNRVAQFITLTALCCVLYQFVTNEEEFTSGPSPAPYHGNDVATTSDGSKYRQQQKSAQFSSSECTCFLACLGLFGLIRRKKLVKQEEEARFARELLLAQKTCTSKAKFHAIIKAEEALHSEVSALTTEQNEATGMCELPLDVLYDLLLFLTPRELAACSIVSKTWDLHMGDRADDLWRLVFKRDFAESGERFQVVFPIDCWRQYYFQHHLSRAVELARLLGIKEDKKCVVIEDQVYDVTSFLHSHPGGYHVIGDVVGTDATEVWEDFQHSNEAKESMKQYIVYDPILSQRREHPELGLKGNLAAAITRWKRISWCLRQSHYLGKMAPTFNDFMYRFHTRAFRKNKKNDQ